MSLSDIRTKVRAFILILAGIVTAFLVFRLLFDLAGFSSTNILVLFINSVSDFFSAPFIGLINIPPILGLVNLNVNIIVAILIYIFGSIAISEIVTAFLYDNIEDILQNIIDGIFKIIEFLIFFRIFFEFFALTPKASSPEFVNSIYGLTEWTQGILFRTPFLNGFINWSAIICLIVIIVLDLLSERFLANIFTGVKKRVTKISHTVKNIVPKPRPTTIKQNITINIPSPEKSEEKKNS